MCRIAGPNRIFTPLPALRARRSDLLAERGDRNRSLRQAYDDTIDGELCSTNANF